MVTVAYVLDDYKVSTHFFITNEEHDSIDKNIDRKLHLQLFLLSLIVIQSINFNFIKDFYWW